MKTIVRVGAMLTFCLNPGNCQVPEKAPAFEVASITPCKPGTPEPPLEHTGMAQFTLPGGTFTARATTLKFLLEWAYGIQPSQHSGGPSWMGVDRYDIVAKAEGHANDEQIKLMVQALLAERFQLKLHHEQRVIPAYVITIGKMPPKLYPPKEGEVHALRFVPQTGPDGKTVTHHVIGTRYTVAQLTDTFARQLGTVVVNRTGLDGEFDFDLDLTPDESRPSPVDPGLLISAMREQLGLTVKYQKTSVDLLVIDGAEKVAAGQ
jgi:uncharacterized protein (TIGR03435 family)